MVGEEQSLPTIYPVFYMAMVVIPHTRLHLNIIQSGPIGLPELPLWHGLAMGGLLHWGAGVCPPKIMVGSGKSWPCGVDGHTVYLSPSLLNKVWCFLQEEKQLNVPFFFHIKDPYIVTLGTENLNKI